MQPVRRSEGWLFNLFRDQFARVRATSRGSTCLDWRSALSRSSRRHWRHHASSADTMRQNAVLHCMHDRERGAGSTSKRETASKSCTFLQSSNDQLQRAHLQWGNKKNLGSTQTKNGERRRIHGRIPCMHLLSAPCAAARAHPIAQRSSGEHVQAFGRSVGLARAIAIPKPLADTGAWESGPEDTAWELYRTHA